MGNLQVRTFPWIWLGCDATHAHLAVHIWAQLYNFPAAFEFVILFNIFCRFQKSLHTFQPTKELI